MVKRHDTDTRARVSKVPVSTAPAALPLSAQCAQELDDIKCRLEAISCTVAVAAGALEGQNADIDVDIATTLRTAVRCALADQLDRLTAVIQKLQ
jgi:hypothetical protein